MQRLTQRARRCIKIAPATGGARPQKRTSFSLFAPFNFFFRTRKETAMSKESKTYKNMPKKVYIRTLG